MKSFLPLKPSDLNLRDWNPLLGLSIPRVVAAEAAAQRGDFVELQWLYRSIEKRYAVLRGSKRRLAASITKLDWNIQIRADLEGEELAMAERQKEVLLEAYGEIGNLRKAIKFLVSAEFRGYAMLERGYEQNSSGKWVVRSLDPVPQWHWCRDGLYGEWCYDPDCRMGGRGMPVDLEAGFIVREVEDPINEIALKAYVFRHFAQIDWANFTEKFGVPFVYWLLSEGIAQALVNDPNKMAEWQQLLDQVTGDGTGIFPGGSLETLQGGSQAGSAPFVEFIKSLDEETVMAATSGMLTMLNDATGLGSGQSESHQNTFDELAQALAGEISEDFQEQFDGPLLEAAFPGQRQLAYFELAAKDEEDVDTLVDHAERLNGTPYAIERTEFSEKSGYTLAEGGEDEDEDENPAPSAEASEAKEDGPAGDEPVRNRGGGADEASALRAEETFARVARMELGEALAADLRGVRVLLEEFLEKDDDALVMDAAELLDALDEEGARVIAEGGETQKAWERIIATATLNGAEAGRLRKN